MYNDNCWDIKLLINEYFYQDIIDKHTEIENIKSSLVFEKLQRQNRPRGFYKSVLQNRLWYFVKIVETKSSQRFLKKWLWCAGANFVVCCELRARCSTHGLQCGACDVWAIIGADIGVCVGVWWWWRWCEMYV